MQTITVKMYPKDIEMLEKAMEMLQKDYLGNLTRSETIRWAIYDQYVSLCNEFPFEHSNCFNCTREHYQKYKNSQKISLTNKSKTAKIKE